MQNLSNLHVPSYLMFMRHAEPIQPVCSILFDIYETHRTSVPYDFHLN